MTPQTDIVSVPLLAAAKLVTKPIHRRRDDRFDFGSVEPRQVGPAEHVQPVCHALVPVERRWTFEERGALHDEAGSFQVS